jgi:Homeobox KN domain
MQFNTHGSEWMMESAAATQCDNTRPVMQAKSRVLKKWLIRHRHTPYPSGGDKRKLAEQCRMTVTQVR